MANSLLHGSLPNNRKSMFNLKINTMFRKILFPALFVAALVITSCSKDPDPVNEAKVLVEYLESADSPLGKDFVSTDMPTIIAADEVKTLNEAGQVYIIDIRSAADFALGHIANAHNVAVADVLTHIEGVNLTPYTKVAIVCYTGQTAGFVTSLLRLMGYSKAYSLKWGMCSWHADFASRWNTAIANGNSLNAVFTATATEKNAKGDLPVLNTGKTTGQEILEARVNALLTEGFSPASVSLATLSGNYTGYYIVNYWPADQYASPGHIPGAVQYTPKQAMKYAEDLTTLPTDKPVALYCYTGQTSAFLSAYLRLLGYDAKSVLYGTNGMIYDNMPATMTKWSAAQIKGYTYVASTK
jgi:rhodanese-related sulfurtransferase